ncbi:MAG: GNAT family N-acetyltransferase [Chloroflexota bacterium]
MGRLNVDKIVIRPVTASDAPAIAELWEALVAYHQALDESLPGAAPNGSGRYTKRLLQHLDDQYTRAFVAEADGKVIGFILGMIVDLLPDIFAQEPGGFLADIYVDTAYRRSGIGRSLVEALIQWFREQDVIHFDWHVAAHNPDAIAFWHSMGGREVMLRMRSSLGEKK